MDNKQTVYVLYNGMGSEYYFTAPSDDEAAAFLRGQNDNPLTEYSSAFPTGVEVTASGSYFLRNGIPVFIHRNIIPEIKDDRDKKNEAFLKEQWNFIRRSGKSLKDRFEDYEPPERNRLTDEA